MEVPLNNTPYVKDDGSGGFGGPAALGEKKKFFLFSPLSFFFLLE